jgi:hypothetical protein
MALNLPPGTGQSVNPAVTPTWVFTPPTSGPATLRVTNTGRYPVYVGGSQLTQNNSLAVPPGGKGIELVGVTQTVYALSGVMPGSASGTMSSSAVTVGTTAITLTAAVPAALAAGTTVLIGYSTVPSALGWEAQVVASTTASSQITFANPLVQDHAGSGVIYTATAQYGQVGVTAGVV